MKTLILGTGIISTIYGWALAESGVDVTHCVRKGKSAAYGDGVTLDLLDVGLGVLAAVLTVGALVYTVLAWKNGYWGIAVRAHYTLVTVAAVAFVWFLNFWNLLGWRF